MSACNKGAKQVIFRSILLLGFGTQAPPFVAMVLNNITPTRHTFNKIF
jgi:hypothetical protein